MQQQRPSGGQQEAASGAGGQYGEGNYAATRQYNEGLKKHLESSDVEQEARDAAPRTAAEESDLQQAERKGRERARGEESPGKGPDDDAALR
jgi:hypothetical protein